MSVTYGFYNSQGQDRKYNASQLSEVFDGLIQDGVFASIGTGLQVVSNAGMTVNVGVGRAWFNHTWTKNDAPLPLVVSASEAILNRIDAVILEIGSASDVRTNSIKIIKGVPGSVPANPVLIKTDGLYQYPLAYIYVGAGVTSIVQANITNKVGTSDCPFVTGILEMITTDDLLLQWQDEFDIWFDNLQTQMAGNVVTNLQNQITTNLDELDAHEAAANPHTGHMNVDGSKSMTGPLDFDAPSDADHKNAVILGQFNVISGWEGGAKLLVGINCYIDNAGNFKYKTTHGTAGARGIVMAYNMPQTYFFDMGAIATVLDTIFIPTLYPIWHSGNDGPGSTLDADTLDFFHRADLALGMQHASTILAERDLTDLAVSEMHVAQAGYIFGVDTGNGFRKVNVDTGVITSLLNCNLNSVNSLCADKVNPDYLYASYMSWATTVATVTISRYSISANTWTTLGTIVNNPGITITSNSFSIISHDASTDTLFVGLNMEYSSLYHEYLYKVNKATLATISSYNFGTQANMEFNTMPNGGRFVTLPNNGFIAMRKQSSPPYFYYEDAFNTRLPKYTSYTYMPNFHTLYASTSGPSLDMSDNTNYIMTYERDYYSPIAQLYSKATKKIVATIPMPMKTIYIVMDANYAYCVIGSQTSPFNADIYKIKLP